MSAAGKPANGRSATVRGFTLLELLVILAIVSLVSAIAFPGVDKAMRRQGFVEAATRFEAALRGARAEAFRAGGAVPFEISADRRGFGYGGSFDSLPEGVVADASGAAIRFYPDGTSSGGLVTLSDMRFELRWRVQPATGAIEMVP